MMDRIEDSSIKEDTIKKVMIKGVEYTIVIINDTKSSSIANLIGRGPFRCMSHSPVIYIKGPEFLYYHVYEKYDSNDQKKNCVNEFNQYLRMGIIKAFYNESGLTHYMIDTDGAFTQDEEITEWYAFNITEMVKVFTELGIEKWYADDLGGYFKDDK